MRIPLLGIAEAASGGTGGQAVMASLSLNTTGSIETSLKVDSRLRAQLQTVVGLARTEALELGFEAPKSLGLQLEIDDQPELKSLVDASYGLAIYAGVLSLLTGTDLRDGIAATGEVNEEGRLLPVKDPGVKEEAARTSDLGVLLYPAGQEEAVPGVPVWTARAGAYFWLGPDFFLSALRCLKEPGAIVCRFVDFMNAYAGHYYPSGWGEALRRVAKENPRVGQAFRENRTSWLLAALSGAPGLSDEMLNDFCQLLQPEHVFSRVWATPDGGERFLTESLAALAKAPEKRLEEALWCAASLFRVVRRSFDVARMLRNGSSISQQILSIKTRVSSYLEDQDPEMLSAWSQISRQLGTLQLLGSEAEIEQETPPLLLLEMVYGRDRLEAIAFSFPDHPEVSPSRLANPVALYDRSSGLPPAWRTSNWSLSACAMSKLPYAKAIFQRFGSVNGFRFPPMGSSHADPTTIRWEGRTGTWPPSIDTLHLVGVLGDRGFYDRSGAHGRVLDLGCGTGVHGVLFGKVEGVTEVVFLDLEPGAQITTTSNVRNNFEVVGEWSEDRRHGSSRGFDCQETVAEVFCGHVLDYFDPRNDDSARFDLTICTPPYVPFVHELQDPTMWKAVSGTDLLRFALTRWREFTDRMVIQFSEIALPEVESLVDGAEPVATHLVGFRIPPLAAFFEPDASPEKLAQGKRWLQRVEPYLINTDADGGLEHHGFKYLHRVRTYLLE